VKIWKSAPTVSARSVLLWRSTNVTESNVGRWMTKSLEICIVDRDWNRLILSLRSVMLASTLHVSQIYIAEYPNRVNIAVNASDARVTREAICARICDRHGGDSWVIEQEGRSGRGQTVPLVWENFREKGKSFGTRSAERRIEGEMKVSRLRDD